MPWWREQTGSDYSRHRACVEEGRREERARRGRYEGSQPKEPKKKKSLAKKVKRLRREVEQLQAECERLKKLMISVAPVAADEPGQE